MSKEEITIVVWGAGFVLCLLLMWVWLMSLGGELMNWASAEAITAIVAAIAVISYFKIKSRR